MHILMAEDDLDLGHALLHALKAQGNTSEWVCLGGLRYRWAP